MDVVEKLVKAVNVVREDAVVDVGAGRGAITAALAERAGAVYAVESDRRLLPYLNAVAHIHPNVKVFHGNFLTHFSKYIEKVNLIKELKHCIKERKRGEEGVWLGTSSPTLENPEDRKV
jgi:16S rRNA A1518/A1519 N6-dimethyltransferase RsmA/KsgA/DIM1 with predicted DNA glycosylase/AP lyase activity